MTQNENLPPQVKIILGAIGVVVLLVVFALFNPFSWNDAGYRTVITQAGGNQKVRFEPGVFYSGFFSKEQEWPNRIIISYQNEEASIIDPEIDENTVEIGPIEGMFSDGPTAKFRGTAQFNLPTDEEKMLEIHNDHKSPQNLISARLGVYLAEALNSSSQLMNSETHYSGGRAQMSQDYLEQMRNGVYIVKTVENIEFDSLEKSNKRVYTNQIVRGPNGVLARKASSIKAYGITVSDASIAGVTYSDQVTQRLKKKVESATEASIAKQKLMTAEQKRLTAEAEGKQKLVEIEYQQKQDQTKQVVAAQTQVELAKQDLEKQNIALQAAYKEAQKVKTLADAEAYAKQRVMQADGALDKKLEAYKEVQGYWANAFSKYEGDITPQIVSGGSGTSGSAWNELMQMIGLRTAKDLTLDLKNK